MIKCYFGVPGCGKTTTLVKIARKELKRLKKIYKEVYTINFECSGAIPIKFNDLKEFKFNNALILIDEITMDADNRSFKTFPAEIRDFFILHRHLGVDIVYATQNYENVDKKIRDLTAELWYMSKSVVPIFREFTTSKRIYRNININEYTSDLTLGYRFCNFIESLFARNFEICFRRKYYKYYDSWDELSLKERPIYKVDSSKRIPEPTSKLERFIKNGRNRKARHNKQTKSSNDPIIDYLNNSNS